MWRVQKVIKRQFIPRPDQLCYDIEKKLKEYGGSRKSYINYLSRSQISYAMKLKTFCWKGINEKVIHTKQGQLHHHMRGGVGVAYKGPGKS